MSTTERQALAWVARWMRERWGLGAGRLGYGVHDSDGTVRLRRRWV